MDTLNSPMGSSSARSTSETHSEKTAASDDEDFKANIPYFDETSPNVDNAPDVNSYPPSNRNMGDVDDEYAGNFGNALWENDNNFMDDARIESDYSSTYSASEGNGVYMPSKSEVQSSPYYQQSAPPDIKFNPNEPNFYPPASSSLHYNYNYPHGRPPPQGLPNSHQNAQSPQHTPHPAYSQHPNPPGFHPNMWYPNAPPMHSNRAYYAPYGSQARYSHYNSGGYAHDPMMDMLQLSNSGREARNRAEKNRRDKLNGSIQELSTMVPHVAESPRRVDKTAVLRFAAHGLRLQYVFGETLNHQRPQLTDSLMKLLDSFFITLTCHGQIVLISSSIEQHLGHCQADLYGQNILHITHPEDHSILKKELVPNELECLFDIQPDDDSGEPRPRTQEEEDYIDKKLREDKRSFTVRLARAGPRSEPTAYEIVKIDGSFRRSDLAPRGIKTSTFPPSLQLIRRTRGRDDTIPLQTISGNDIVLVAIARVIQKPKVQRVIEANSLEYRTRHLIDGRIIDCDQRIGIVAGYMTDEVRNLSPFTFMHQDDVRWVIVALRQMYDCNSSYGESTYRLLTRNGNFIYLQSTGYLEIDKDSNKVHSFVCVNTLLDEEDGKRRVQEMKNKFSAIINAKIPQSSIDAPASDNPQQLEKAVLCLIQNLQKSSSDDEDGDRTTATSNSVAHRMHSMSNPMPSPQPPGSACSSRSTKTPPALVPPEASTVKSSIFKSVSVVNVTAGKNLRGIQQVKSPHPTEESCETGYDSEINADNIGCTCQGNDGDFACAHCNAACNRTPSLKRSSRTSCSEDEDIKLAKRRLKSTEIEHVLSTSLDQIGRSLNQQLNTVIELRDQGNKYEVPNANQRIDEIMEEHQKQSEIYVHIKSEYEIQVQNKAIDINTSTTRVTEPPRENDDDFKPRPR